MAASDPRYTHLKGNIYYDNKDKVIVQNLGNRFVFMRHDRRTKQKSVEEGKRAEDKFSKNFLLVQGTLYFDKHTRQLYRKTGANFVLYAKDRRKERKTVTADRRKKQI